jgi:hypothetical protein
VLVSIPFLILACLCVGGGRIIERRARRAPRGKRARRFLGWALMIVGLLLMTLGVLLW